MLHGATLSAVIIAAALITSPAEAKKKKKQEEPVPCPIEGPIRIADKASIKGVMVLEGCADQIVESPPDPPRQPADDVEIEGGSESPYITNMDQARPKKARGTSAQDDGRPIYLTSAGGVRSIRIVPAAEVSDPAQPASVGASGMTAAPRGSGGRRATAASIQQNPESILGLRPGTYTTSFDNLIEQVARRHRIDPLFLHAVIKQESGYRPAIASHAGAKGLMQIMPATGRMLGLAPHQLTDPAANVDAGARLLRKLHKRYDGNFTLMLAAYNAGEGAVAKYGNRVPPFRETQHYVKAVMAHYYKLLESATGATVGAPAQ